MKRRSILAAMGAMTVVLSFVPSPGVAAMAAPVHCAGWQLQAPAKAGLTVGFHAVAATSPTDVWAVGYRVTRQGVEQPAVERWNGVRWKEARLGWHNGFLNGVAAVSSEDVWAVGAHHATIGAMFEHWDGRGWSVVSGAPAPRVSDLFAVSGTSSTDVWAVGERHTKQGIQPLIEHFDGRAWSLIDNPQVGTYGVLSGVVAIAPDDAWAVGVGPSDSLIEHWDGTRWTVVENPGTAQLYGVAAASSTDVWAVGENGITEHWDGTAWTLAAIAPPPRTAQVLWGVSVSATGTAWAVGFQSDPGDLPQTLTERWNRSAWRYVRSVNPDPNDDELRGVVAVGPNAWAVGAYTGSPRPLIEYRSC